MQNAIQAIEAAETTGTRELRIATRVAENMVLLSVADNGCGMEAEVQRRMFEPLFSTKAFGVGLGMPLVKRIIEQHGGTVGVESRLGQGTMVMLRLPLQVDV